MGLQDSWLRFTNKTVCRTYGELDGNCDDLATVRWQGFSSLRMTWQLESIAQRE
ncbi:hypothetical protein CCACVL1_25304 [Corchorus capsularis]|uniref:Uncharacterized protein n=1 Tax=Corchorus capsularis TaxID=210143 RepID=A0A1R3GLB0_COCAP|nr:hypothetical protein CCACVL1_25304 [Corchorus capsularis]